ncbi:putative anion-transporting ATPase [Gordonia soli NBRC 108243]|uniref:Putative anion-transporting ATPase n=1 Tax=Gordonia soli NBRC 108243 TaxID=1223545 RepID=M0QM85_9ACTN|nr:putative anion-transporting ATPase [Gordonia soli NBRC 108243]
MSVVAAAGALGPARATRRRNDGGGRTPTRLTGVPVTRTEHDTLLITIDRTSPATQMLGVFRAPDEPVAVSANLHLLALDRLELLENTWEVFTDVLAATLTSSAAVIPGVGALAEVASGELTTLPGIEDFLALRRIRDEAISGRWRRIIVDCSGGTDPFTFLRAGAVLGQAFNRLWPRHRRLAAAAERPVVAQLTAAIDTIDRDCHDVTELFADAHAVAVHLVVPDDARGTRLTPHLLGTIDMMGLALRSVIVNRGTGARTSTIADSRLSATQDARDTQDASATGDAEGTESAEASVVSAIGELPPGVDLRIVDPIPEPIDRAARLRRLGVELGDPSGRAQGAAAATVVSLGGPGPDGEYEMRWRQRLPDPGSLRLGRVGDDLLVTVGGFRQPVTLPSVLRRCRVVDATWDGTVMVVRFTPDPAVWPRAR